MTIFIAVSDLASSGKLLKSWQIRVLANHNCASFRQLIEAEKVKALVLPPKSPNLNAFAERCVRSVKDECLSKLILFGERSFKRALHHYEMHYHQERNHQGKDNLLLFPLPLQPLRRKQGKLRCRERLGGLLKYYEREAV
jgi:transposase InsO family protein